ncbi:major facilitator superfamily domain-containing protein [Cyathus striatus]|nr:major facilitator superfamily domain-containing protein [Cyathus striatus]
MSIYRLIPVVLVMSMSRGITMSPRIQVYKAIACRILSEKDTTSSTSANLVDFVSLAIDVAVVTTMSVLSAISTGFWSRLGDTHGRKPILLVFLLGALTMEAVFVLVMRENTIFSKYGEKLILLGPILEGLVGAISTFNGVVHAYVSDCTRPGSRARIFSTVQGIVFVGLSLGPWFGGFFLPKTGYSDAFFFVSISLIVAIMAYVFFLLPESRFPPEAPRLERQPSGSLQLKTSVQVAKVQLGKFMAALLSPIMMFRPRSIPGSKKRDWNMTLVGLALFIYLVSIGVYSAKYLYAQHVYDWTTAQLGYYMSILWFTRALNLLIFLPILISFLKPKLSTPLNPNDPNATSSPEDIAKELTFDKYLAACSLALDGLADALVAAISGGSQLTFTVLSCLSSFTSGGNPTLHSLGGVCLHACGYGSEVGALFGAMAVLSAIAHIISPTVYAVTYAATVSRFPQAIFVLAASLLFFAVFLLSWVYPKDGKAVEGGGDEEMRYGYQRVQGEEAEVAEAPRS